MAPEEESNNASAGRWASDELLPVVYAELRRLAAARLAREPNAAAGYTLQPTALVHEAYMRLAVKDGGDAKLWSNTGHFFAAAAEAMRRILVERARRRIRHDRAGKREPITLSELTGELDAPPVDMLSLDAALAALERADDRKYQVVMLRFFAGVSLARTAELLAVSEMTVQRDWTFARAWLIDHINGDAGAGGEAAT
ncbi:MAG: ECF-type sigma factor [Phycisphaerales bacterium]